MSRSTTTGFGQRGAFGVTKNNTVSDNNSSNRQATNENELSSIKFTQKNDKYEINIPTNVHKHAMAEYFNYTIKYTSESLKAYLDNQYEASIEVHKYLTDIDIERVQVVINEIANYGLDGQQIKILTPILIIKVFQDKYDDMEKIKNGDWSTKAFGGLELIKEDPVFLLYSSIATPIDFNNSNIQNQLMSLGITSGFRLNKDKPTCKLETRTLENWLILIHGGFRLYQNNTGTKFCQTNEWQFGIRFCPKCKIIGKHDRERCEDYFCIHCMTKLKVSKHDCSNECMVCKKVKHDCNKSILYCRSCNTKDHQMDRINIRKCANYETELKSRNKRYKRILEICKIETKQINKKKLNESDPNKQNVQSFEEQLKNSETFKMLTNEVTTHNNMLLKQGKKLEKLNSKVKNLACVPTQMDFLIKHHAKSNEYVPPENEDSSDGND